MLNKKILNNIYVLLTGTVVAQLIPVIVSPLLTRIYTPSEFGMLAIFMSCATVFSIFANFRLDAAIMSAENPKEKSILKNLSLLSTTLFTIFLIILFIIFDDFFKSLYSGIEYKFILFFIPIYVFLFGLNQVYTYICNSNGDYKIISKSKVDKNISISLIQILLGFNKLGLLGLLLGNILGFLLPFFRMRKFTYIVNEKYSKNEMIFVLKKYKKYPLVSTSSAVMDTVASEAPIIFMNKFQSSEVIGFFDLARKTVLVPLSFISVSVSQIYLKQITEEKEQNKNVKLTLFILGGLTLISICIAPIFIYWGEDLFAAIFGENWRIVGGYLKILIFPFLIRFIVSPLSVIFLKPSNILIGSMWQFFHLFSSVITALIFLPKGIEVYLIAYSIVEVLSYTFYLSLIFYTLKKK